MSDRGRDRRDRSPDRRHRRSLTPIHLRKKKLNNWDQPPPGYDGMTVQQVKAMGHFPVPGQPSRNVGGPGLYHHVPVEGPSPIHLEKESRRIYAGNLPADTKEQELISFLNEMMYEMKLTRGVGRPVMSAQLNLKKRYALVEFRTPEEATAAQKLHNVLYRGLKLDVKRPKDYVDIVSPKHTVDITSILVADSPYKIFVGGIPPYLTEEQVIELFQSFGPLRAFNLVKDAGSSLSKGFGFCEYMDTNITDIACQGLNGMDLGGKKLIVQRASLGQNKPLPAGISASATLHSIVPTKALTGASSLDNPTSVLLLLNMFDKEDIDEPSDYAGILNDIKSELSQYGAVKKVFIPYPGIDIKSDLGKAFVHYEQVDDCVTAMKQLAGRRFLDRLIVTAFYPEDKFLKGIYAE